MAENPKPVPTNEPDWQQEMSQYEPLPTQMGDPRFDQNLKRRETNADAETWDF